MNKFQVGDKIVAKPNNVYFVINDGWVGYVIHVYDDGWIQVSKNKDADWGMRVEPKYFDLAKDIDFFMDTQFLLKKIKENIDKRKKEAKKLNIRVLCIKNKNQLFRKCFTVGKIYEVHDGKIICNHKVSSGVSLKTREPYNSFEALNADAKANEIEFIKIVD